MLNYLFNLLSLICVTNIVFLTNVQGALTPSSITFDSQVVGYTQPTKRITLSNTSATAVTLESLRTQFDPSFSKEWAPQSGNAGAAYWRIVDDVYQYEASGASGECLSFYKDGTMSDYSVSVDVAQSIPSNYGYCGLIIRGTKDLNPYAGGGQGYHFAICPSYDGVGGFAIFRFDGNLIHKMCDWIWTPVIKNGVGTNRLIVSLHGDQLSFFINGNLVYTYKDNYFTGPGFVGLEGRSSSGQPRIYSFSNLRFDAPIPPDGYITKDTFVGIWGASSAPATCVSEDPAERVKFLEPPALSARIAKVADPSVSNLGDAGTASLEVTPFPLSNLPTLPLTLAAGESTAFDVGFAPQSIGATRFAVRATMSTSGTSSEEQVALQGTGLADRFVLSGDDTPAFSGHPGGPFEPSSFSRTVFNQGAESYEFEIRTPEWLTATPATGTLAPNASITIVFTPNATGAAYTEGDHTGQVEVWNTTLQVRQRFDVRFEVYLSPSISVDPRSIEVTCAVGETLSRTFTISNAATADAPLKARATSYEISRDLVNSSLAADLAQERAAILEPHRNAEVRVADQCKEDEILVRFEPSLSTRARVSARSSVLARVGAQVLHEYTLVPGLTLIKVPQARTASLATKEETLRSIQEVDGVRYAEMNTLRRLNRTPDDTHFDKLWAMKNVGQTSIGEATVGTPGADISATKAWDLTTGSRSVVIGVIDTGVDYTHPDLEANIWTNPGEIPNNGIDDDNNGYIDDVHGWNGLQDNGDPMDQHNHGTHCAGTIGAVANNGTGVAGVCWDVQIMPLRFLDSSGHGSDSDAIKCMEYAAKMGVRILSNSWGGGGYSQATRDAIAELGKLDILFVVAAGNEYNNNDVVPNYPASYDCDNILAVLNTNNQDQRHPSSCYGLKSVDIAAPGTDIVSTVIGNRYMSFTGTSMATPHVAGAAGLLLAYKSDLTALSMKSILMESGDPMTSEAAWTLSGKRLNLYRALSGIPRWIKLQNDEVSALPPGSTHTVTIDFSAEDLQQGVYKGAISILTNDRQAPTLTIPVTMTVVAGDLSVAPVTPFVLESSGPELGPFEPNASSVRLFNNHATQPLSWSISKSTDVSWLTLSGTSGTSGTLQPGAVAIIDVAIDATIARDLPVGSYKEELIIRNLTSGIEQKRTVTLAVNKLFESLDTVYVDAARLGDGGSGSNWETAKRTIQAGIEAVNEGGTVIVKDGVYEPVNSTKNVTVRSLNGPAVTSINGQQRTRCVNAYENNNGEYQLSPTYFIGFTLENGRIEDQGGGANGGTFENCIFRNNAAVYGGGAANATLINCLVVNNTLITTSLSPTGGWGGGVCWGKALNCTIVNNHSISANSEWGSGAGFCNTILVNSIVWQNTDASGVLDNWRHDSVTGSSNNLSQSLISGDNNLVGDPQLNALYRPANDSPAIDAGRSDIVASYRTSTDLAGASRIVTLVDIGCYELQAISSEAVQYVGSIQAASATFPTGQGIQSLDAWNNHLDSTLRLTNTFGPAQLTFDAPVIANSVTLTGTQPLTLAAAFVPTVKAFDFSAFDARLTVPFSTGSAAIFPGSDTLFEQAGTAPLEIEAKQGVTLQKEWGAAVSGVGDLTLELAQKETPVTLPLRDYLGPITLKRGTWSFTAKDKYPNKNAVTIAGPDAVLSADSVDTTGYEIPAAKKALTVRDGASYLVNKRDSICMPLTLHNGGKIVLAADSLDDGRALDLYKHSVLRATGAAINTIGGKSATSLNQSGIIGIRNPEGLTVDVAKDATLDVYAQWGSTGDSSTTPWCKTGEGTLIFHRKSKQTGLVNINEGVVKLAYFSDNYSGDLGSGVVTFANNTTLDLSEYTSVFNVNARGDANAIVKIDLTNRYIYNNLRLMNWTDKMPDCKFVPIGSDGYILVKDSNGLKVSSKLTFKEYKDLLTADINTFTQAFNALDDSSLPLTLTIVGAGHSGKDKSPAMAAAAATLLGITPTFAESSTNPNVTVATVDYDFSINQIITTDDPQGPIQLSLIIDGKHENDPTGIQGELYLETSTNLIDWTSTRIENPLFIRDGYRSIAEIETSTELKDVRFFKFSVR